MSMGNVFEVKSHQPRVRLVLDIQYTGRSYPSAFLTPEPSTGHTLNSQSSHLYTVSSACYTYSYKGTIEAVVYKAPTPPLCLLPSDLHGSLRMWLYVIALPLASKNNDPKTSFFQSFLYVHLLICPHAFTEILTLLRNHNVHKGVTICLLVAWMSSEGREARGKWICNVSRCCGYCENKYLS